MNIFYTDRDPFVAARNLCDKHVLKQTVETAQMLAAAYHHPAVHLPPPRKMNGEPYARGYWNHPVQKWVRAHPDHWQWTICHFAGLLEEYADRFGQSHGCRPAYLYMTQFPAGPRLPVTGDAVEPPQCMPDEYRCDDPVVAYRTYYVAEKSRFAMWERGVEPPVWFTIGRVLELG